MNRSFFVLSLTGLSLACATADTGPNDAAAAGISATQGPVQVPTDSGQVIEIRPMAHGAPVFVPDCEKAGSGAQADHALAACDAPPKAQKQACPQFSGNELKEPALAELASACARWEQRALPQYILTRETVVAGLDADPLWAQSYVVGGEVQSASVNGMPVLVGDTVFSIFAEIAPLASMGLSTVEISYDEDLGFISEVAIRTMDQGSWTLMSFGVVEVWPELDREQVIY